MSTNTDIDSDSSIDTLNNIGEKRSEDIPADNVGELAAQTVDEVVDESGLHESIINDAVKQAREAVGVDPYTPADTDSDVTAEVESFGDDVDAFIEATDEDDSPDPADCTSVAILAGDDAFGAEGEHSDLAPDEQAQLVQKRLVEFGFTNIDEVVAPASGMGRQAVNNWASYTKRETEQELPALTQVSVDEYSADGYRERNEKILEAVDGIAVVANGEYVGMWVQMANDADVLIETPAYDDDEDDDNEGPDWSDL